MLDIGEGVIIDNLTFQDKGATQTDNTSPMKWTDATTLPSLVNLKKRKRNYKNTRSIRVCENVSTNQYYCYFDHYKPGLSISCKVCDHLYRRWLDSQQDAMNVAMADSGYGVMSGNALADIGEQEATDGVDTAKNKDKGKRKYILVPNTESLPHSDTGRMNALNDRIVRAASKVMVMTKASMEPRSYRKKGRADIQTVYTCKSMSRKQTNNNVSSLPEDRVGGSKVYLAPAKLIFNAEQKSHKKKSQEHTNNILNIASDGERYDTDSRFLTDVNDVPRLSN